MKKALCAVVAISCLTLVFCAAAAALPPDSASVSGVTNSDWPDGVSNVAGFGQLLEQRDGGIDSTSVIVWSGLATEARMGHVILDPSINSTATASSILPGSSSNDPIAETANMAGANYAIAYKSGGRISGALVRAASSVTKFSTEEQAVAALETAIAAGNPVEVNVDFFDLFDSVSSQLPGLAKRHESRFIIVTAYDLNNITFTDNRPASVLKASGEDVVVPWWAFRQGWRDTRTLATDQPVYGSWFMLTVISDPVPADADFVLATLGYTSQAAPGQLYKAAVTARRTTTTTLLNALLRSAPIFVDVCEKMSDFAEADGQAAVADIESTCADHWSSLIGNQDGLTSFDTLSFISGEQSNALAVMRTLASGLDPVDIVSPADALPESDLFPVTFRWRSSPTTGATLLQISANGNFSDKTALFTFKPPSGNTVITISTKEWTYILRKVGGNRTVSWRITNSKKIAITPARTIVFAVPAITALTPDDGAVATEAALPTFSWTQSLATASPRVVIRVHNDFVSKMKQLTLRPRAGQTSIAMSLSQFRALEKLDTTGTAYWRVEDAAIKSTGVQPSTARSITLE